MEDRTARVDAECSGSIQRDCVPSQFSKPYLMYSATDAASATVDFIKGNVEDGVVNNPPSRGAGRSPICSPSPLQGCDWIPTGQRLCSLTERTVRTPQRQLYSKLPICSIEEAKETDPVHYDNEVRIQPATKLRESLSYGFGRHQLPEKRGRLLQTKSLTSQPSLQLSTRDCVSTGRNAYSVRYQSYPEPSLFTLIRQCRERERASAGVSCPKAYSHRDEILKGMAKLKSEKMGNVGMNMP
jgi:hypothetical protein